MTCVRCQRDIEHDSTYCRFCGAAMVEPATRRLTRIPEAGRVAGVCAGLAAYFETDATLIRLAWVVLSIVPGAVIGGIIAYAAGWVLMPASAVVPVHITVSRRLVRPVAERRIAGVCAGLAQFSGIDPTVVRVLWVVLSLYPGAIVGGLLLYVVAWMIIPSEANARMEALRSAA